MPTKTEIIEAGARAVHEDQCSSPDEVCNPDCFRAKEVAEVALSAILPLIKQQLVAEMKAEGYKRDVLMTPDEVDLVEELVGIVERFEL